MRREETVGLSASLVGHVTLLALLTYGVFLLPKARPVEPQAMEVAFVDEAGLTSAAPDPTTEAPMIGAATEAGPIEDAASAPAPAVAPVPPQAPVARQTIAPPQRQVRQQTRPSPQPGTGERTRRSILDDSNFLKGIGTDRTSQSNRAPAQMTGAQRSSFRSLIARALMPCEDQRFPAPEARAIKVHVRVTLNRDGSRASAEVTRVQNSDSSLSRYEQRMRELALAVVRGCTPIRGLPDQFYDVPGGWRQFDYQFPRNS